MTDKSYGTNRKHQPVLLKEVIEYLNPQSNEDFVDATFGDGGHAWEILKRIVPEGKLLGIDLDYESLKKFEGPALNKAEGSGLDTGSAHLKESEPPISRSGIESRSSIGSVAFKNRLFLEVGNFADIKKISPQYFESVDGVLFDFGLRTGEIEDSRRGFSFMKNGPLDMRFDRAQSLTAAEIINTRSEKELARIFKEYGEEKNAGKIAWAVVEARKQKKIITTGELVEILNKTHRSYGTHKTHSRIFQALRVAVNNELENIKLGLEGAWEILKPRGRIAAISFHSLEDRLVKNFFKEKLAALEAEILTKKPITPSEDETELNSRSRSAKLRAIRKK